MDSLDDFLEMDYEDRNGNYIEDDDSDEYDDEYDSDEEDEMYDSP